MKAYTVHMRRHGLDHEKDIVLVGEGFSWPAFLFTAVWALYYRLWVPAAVIIAVFAALGSGFEYAGLGEPVVAVLGLGVSVIVGFLAGDVRRRALEKAGFANVDIVVADSVVAAEQRYFDRKAAAPGAPHTGY